MKMKDFTIIMITIVVILFASCKKEPLVAPLEENNENSPNITSLELEVLGFVNTLRSNGCNCGNLVFPAVEELYWNDLLDEASEMHVKDMYDNNFVSHYGSDGSTPSDRLNKVDYEFFFNGENIAKGPPTAEIVIQEFHKSPSHCATMMNENYTHLGIAKLEKYWVLNFAKPRN